MLLRVTLNGIMTSIPRTGTKKKQKKNDEKEE